MNEKEELIQELQQELQWVKYRQKMLDMMEEKLMEMKLLAEQAKQINMSSEELEIINNRLNNLASQVRAIDSESRRTENEKVIV